MAPGDYANTRFSALSDINTTNVSQLKEAWTFATGTLGGHEAAPLIVGGTMFVVTPFPNTLYALDLTKPGGAIKWRYDPDPQSAAKGVACCDTVNRGAAYADGRVFINTLTPATRARHLDRSGRLPAKHAKYTKGVIRPASHGLPGLFYWQRNSGAGAAESPVPPLPSLIRVDRRDPRAIPFRVLRVFRGQPAGSWVLLRGCSEVVPERGQLFAGELFEAGVRVIAAAERVAELLREVRTVLVFQPDQE